jgi:uncharacterized protein YgiM (DUF1202 family)
MEKRHPPLLTILLLLFSCACFALPVPALNPPSAPTFEEPPARKPTPKTAPTRQRRCVVNADVLNLRACAGTRCTTRAWLKKGAVLTILSTQDQWLNVETPNRDTGWVHSKFCSGDTP